MWGCCFGRRSSDETESSVQLNNSRVKPVSPSVFVVGAAPEGWSTAPKTGSFVSVLVDVVAVAVDDCGDKD
jgi:hypothetical protein